MKLITVVTKSKHHNANYMGKEKRNYLKILKIQIFIFARSQKSRETSWVQQLITNQIHVNLLDLGDMGS